MDKIAKGEIVKLGDQRRITLLCTNCGYFGLMLIKAKTKVEKRINYYVCCPECSHNFKQIGRPYNFWRSAKKNHNLSHEELRTMQKQLLRKFFKDGEFKAKQTFKTIEIGDLVFIKPNKPNN
jgi:hypothetical protein